MAIAARRRLDRRRATRTTPPETTPPIAAASRLGLPSGWRLCVRYRRWRPRACRRSATSPRRAARSRVDASRAAWQAGDPADHILVILSGTLACATADGDQRFALGADDAAVTSTRSRRCLAGTPRPRRRPSARPHPRRGPARRARRRSGDGRRGAGHALRERDGGVGRPGRSRYGTVLTGRAQELLLEKRPRNESTPSAVSTPDARGRCTLCHGLRSRPRRVPRRARRGGGAGASRAALDAATRAAPRTGPARTLAPVGALRAPRVQRAEAGVMGVSKAKAHFPSLRRELHGQVGCRHRRRRRDGVGRGARGRRSRPSRSSSWFLDPDDWVVPPTAMRCIPLDRLSASRSPTCPPRSRTRSASSALAIWLDHVKRPETILRRRPLRDATARTPDSVADFNLFDLPGRTPRRTRRQHPRLARTASGSTRSTTASRSAISSGTTSSRTGTCCACRRSAAPSVDRLRRIDAEATWMRSWWSRSCAPTAQGVLRARGADRADRSVAGRPRARRTSAARAHGGRGARRRRSPEAAPRARRRGRDPALLSDRMARTSTPPPPPRARSCPFTGLDARLPLPGDGDVLDPEAAQEGALHPVLRRRRRRMLGWRLRRPRPSSSRRSLNMVVAAIAVAVFSQSRDACDAQALTLTLHGRVHGGVRRVYTLVLPHPGDATVWSFYLFGDLFSTIMVATFFAFLNDSVSPAASKRLYGPIVLGGVGRWRVRRARAAAAIDRLAPDQWLWICCGLGRRDRRDRVDGRTGARASASRPRRRPAGPRAAGVRAIAAMPRLEGARARRCARPTCSLDRRDRRALRDRRRP